MSQFLVSVLMVVILANIWYAIWSFYSLRKLLKEKGPAKMEDRFLIEHIIHTRSSLNLIYTSIATITIFITFFGLNLKDRVADDLRTEISKSVSDTLRSTPIRQISDSAHSFLESIKSNTTQSDDLLKMLQTQPKDLKLVPGSTPEDGAGWQKYRDGIMIHINTGLRGLRHTPLYLASLYGISENATAVGVNAIYDASDQGFTVYVFQANPSTSINPEKARDFKWHVRWVAVLNQ